MAGEQIGLPMEIGHPVEGGEGLGITIPNS
jgi:hypothetical protein